MAKCKRVSTAGLVSVSCCGGLNGGGAGHHAEFLEGGRRFGKGAGRFGAAGLCGVHIE